MASLKEYAFSIPFDNFSNMPEDRMISSKEFTCVGRKWCIQIDPNSAGNVKIYLRSLFDEFVSITVDYDLHVRNFNEQADSKATYSGSNVMFPSKNELGGWRYWYGTRRKTLNSIKDGTLMVDVRIRPRPDPYGINIPEESANCNGILSALWKDRRGADVAFNVKGKQIDAHKFLLTVHAPDLLTDFCDSCDMTNPLPIEDVHHAIFQAMIDHAAYGRNIPLSMWEEHTKGILEASNKYGFKTLKSEAERWYMKSEKLTIDTVIDELLYAISHNLPILKKAAIDFIVKHAEEVIKSVSWHRVYESEDLWKEVLIDTEFLLDHYDCLKASLDSLQSRDIITTHDKIMTAVAEKCSRKRQRCE